MRGFKSFFSRWQNWLGLLLVGFFIIVAVFAPVLSPNDPDNPGVEKIVGNRNDLAPHPPNDTARLGTISRQVDVYHALVWGTRAAVIFGITAAIIIAVLGILIGTVSAYFGGSFNNLIMRVTDAFLSFPVIAGIVVIQQLFTILMQKAGVMFISGYQFTGFFGEMYNSLLTGYYANPTGIPPILLLLQQVDSVWFAIVLFSWMPYARVMNVSALRIKQTQYFLAARTVGARHSRLIFRHLIPNSITPVIVLAARDVGGMVLLQATFTFIGLGGNSPWGMLLVRGRDWIVAPGGILTYWWVFLPATLALLLFGIGWNLLGDGLNDALNPRIRD